jgi:hypothetical protein
MKGFLEDTNYFSNIQYGFRSNRSTTKALATVMDELLTNTDNDDLTIAVYLDFKKAFDTIDHHILITKLRRAGFDEKTCNLITNYLTNRKQHIRLNGADSMLQQVTTGVPKGSTLGPILFLIFINDLPLVSQLAIFTLFADVLTVHGKCLKVIAELIEAVLCKIHAWCRDSKLTLNAEKTEYVVYGTKTKKANAPPVSLHIGGTLLREVNSYKYLGTVLDATLSGTQQISKLTSHWH